MTASTGNARRAMTLLKQSLDALGHPRVSAVADVVGKCLESLAAQVEFYEGIKSPLRRMIVQDPDGTHRPVSAMELASLPLANTPHIVYGSPEAIAALTAQLARFEEADPCQTSSPSAKAVSSTM
ncbi:hypothetical protein [Roseibium polysiphoniae]|uniref:hypothetical protein n=1 Tax=Roseibium polysiphoniae TaxID=2571221 RepID=UPI00329A6DD1